MKITYILIPSHVVGEGNFHWNKKAPFLPEIANLYYCQSCIITHNFKPFDSLVVAYLMNVYLPISLGVQLLLKIGCDACIE